ncbi:hypothetical protein RRG08_047613 [Elysia crispata]|uniref:Uncharacterized protein n=1 Tax=Elysia crispata TaxID=231223 RepID=A0AAE1BE01_9GAST|nr:hypothetical protein RRG08_047613 [Elysia crispata]
MTAGGDGVTKVTAQAKGEEHPMAARTLVSAGQSRLPTQENFSEGFVEENERRTGQTDGQTQQRAAGHDHNHCPVGIIRGHSNVRPGPSSSDSSLGHPSVRLPF